MPDGFSITLVKSLVLVNLVMAMFAILTWVERRLIGRFQVRLGPNRVGPFGLLQPIADLGKLLRKESIMPERRQPVPLPARAGDLAVRGAGRVRGRSRSAGRRRSRSPTASSTSRSRTPTSRLLLVFALGSFSFYGFLVGGWSSSSKYSLYGSMRAVVPAGLLRGGLALAVIGVVMMAQTLVADRHRRGPEARRHLVHRSRSSSAS